jgi:hypothetical protein
MRTYVGAFNNTATLTLYLEEMNSQNDNYKRKLKMASNVRANCCKHSEDRNYRGSLLRWLSVDMTVNGTTFSYEN